MDGKIICHSITWQQMKMHGMVLILYTYMKVSCDLLNVYLNFVFFYMDVKLKYGLLKVELWDWFSA